MEISAEAVHGCRLKYHRLASAFDEAEEALNEGLGCAHELIAAAATATSAMLRGLETGARTRRSICRMPSLLSSEHGAQ